LQQFANGHIPEREGGTKERKIIASWSTAGRIIKHKSKQKVGLWTAGS